MGKMVNHLATTTDWAFSDYSSEFVILLTMVLTVCMYQGKIIMLKFLFCLTYIVMLKADVEQRTISLNHVVKNVS